MESWHKINIAESDDSVKETMSAMLMFNGAESVVDQGQYLEVYLYSENKEALIDYISTQAIFCDSKVENEKVDISISLILDNFSFHYFYHQCCA